MAEPVKGTTEAGRRREERARRTRRRIVSAAGELFLERGYPATTVVAIAEAAGVAPATVYQAFGTKQAVLAALLDTTIAGDDDAVPLLEREWASRAARLSTPQRRLAAVVRQAVDVVARTAPLKQVMRDAAAVEPDVWALIREDHQRRRQTQRAMVEIAIGSDRLRRGLTREQAADTFFLLVTSDAYRLAVEELGVSAEEWRRRLVRLLSRELFGE